MLVLRLDAPFAVCRTFTAGWYRPTATFLTPSAAYGLVLNLAGVEMRLREEDAGYPAKGGVPATLIRDGLPAVRLAVGAAGTDRRGEPVPFDRAFPRPQTVYQQLHNYPVGNSGGERAATAFGNKFNITPVRRELLTDLRAVVAVDGNVELEAAIRAGLEYGHPGRYGLPFLGDNSFLPDHIDPLTAVPATYWYGKVTDGGLQPRTTRLTTWIDRADLSQTRSHLFAPAGTAGEVIPDESWVSLPPPPE